MERRKDKDTGRGGIAWLGKKDRPGGNGARRMESLIHSAGGEMRMGWATEVAGLTTPTGVSTEYTPVCE